MLPLLMGDALHCPLVFPPHGRATLRRTIGTATGMTLDGLHLVVLASLLLWSATLQEIAAARKTSHHNQTPQLEQCE